MHPRFAAFTDPLHDSYERLIASAPMPAGHRWPADQVRGVYLFSDGNQHLYTGRTNHVRRRYSAHHRESVKDSPFAFRLAREATKNMAATYRPGIGSRAELLKDPAFIDAFRLAKARIRAMDFRWVEESDPVRQCLLEVYVAVVLQTPYNDFDNH